MDLSPLYAENSLLRAKLDISLLVRNIKMLEGKKSKLKDTFNTLPECQWTLVRKELDCLQQSIRDAFTKFENDKFASNDLKRRIRERKRKRSRIRRCKSEKQSERRKAHLNRKLLHATIDKHLAKEKQKDVEAQQARNAAEYAKWVLENVTKKKADAQRYIILLSSLKALRRARRTAALKTYEDGGSEFDTKMDGLIAVWADAIEEYEKEETNLKSILDDSHKSAEEQWLEVFFGVVDKCSMTNTAKDDKNMANFIEIRRVWDSCLVPYDSEYGSCIPSGWILPPKMPADSWKKYRK